jgi:hypothetical protein
MCAAPKTLFLTDRHPIDYVCSTNNTRTVSPTTRRRFLRHLLAEAGRHQWLDAGLVHLGIDKALGQFVLILGLRKKSRNRKRKGHKKNRNFWTLMVAVGCKRCESDRLIELKKKKK